MPDFRLRSFCHILRARKAIGVTASVKPITTMIVNITVSIASKIKGVHSPRQIKPL